jgi:hypothetical protein
MLSDNPRLAYTAPKAAGNHRKSDLNSNSSRKHQREAQSPLMRYTPAIVVLSPFQFVLTALTRGQSRINSKLVSTTQSSLLSITSEYLSAPCCRTACGLTEDSLTQHQKQWEIIAKAISTPVRLESTDARLKVLSLFISLTTPAVSVLSPFQFVSTALTRSQSRINSRLVTTAQSSLLSITGE